MPSFFLHSITLLLLLLFYLLWGGWWGVKLKLSKSVNVHESNAICKNILCGVRIDHKCKSHSSDSQPRPHHQLLYLMGEAFSSPGSHGYIAAKGHFHVHVDDICIGLVGMAHRMSAAVVRRGGAAWCCLHLCSTVSEGLCK